MSTTLVTALNTALADVDIQYLPFTQGGTDYRIGVRSNIIVMDKVLGGTGFDGAEDTDWTNVFEQL